MKPRILALIFGFACISAGFPQASLVLKDCKSGREWSIRKGMSLFIPATVDADGFRKSSQEGILVAMTDSSLTLRSKEGSYSKTVLFRDIRQVKVRQSRMGEGTGMFIAGLGIGEIIVAPFMGMEESGPYNYSRALTALSVGLLLTATGYLILNPYTKNYRVTDVCHSRNERFLRNGSGTYYFSLATGFGPNYGGYGFRLQSRIGRIAGVGFHVGMGWDFQYLTDSTKQVPVPGSFSVLTGVKFFPYRGWYVDIAFGNFGRMANVTARDNVFVVHDTYTPYGFVFSGGGDWIWGRTFGFNLGLGCAVDLTAPRSSNTFPTIEMGFIVKL